MVRFDSRSPEAVGSDWKDFPVIFHNENKKENTVMSLGFTIMNSMPDNIWYETYLERGFSANL